MIIRLKALEKRKECDHPLLKNRLNLKKTKYFKRNCKIQQKEDKSHKKYRKPNLTIIIIRLYLYNYCFSDTLKYKNGAEGDRTPDLMTASHTLSQLSYSPKKKDYLTIEFGFVN